MRAMALRIWLVCWLVLVWLLLWGSVSAANILSGLAVALVIMLLLPLPPVPVEGRVHLLSLIRLVLMVAGRLVVSSAQVAWLAIRPGPPPMSAVLRAHVNVKSDLVLALAANIINLTPGTIALEIDQPRRLMYIHVLGVDNDRALQSFYHQISSLEKLLVTAFERDADWQPSAREQDSR
ncbi:Na+/H+ antiporter subunit E [Mycolicibacterium duvalii]|nr:Na+/H+ antiporter subunit E [Mycolicibacterium duvalii]MCV7369137.1 Na+/H+ antiporter subunit E [Mycolicibacterium duvalii]PEG44210.1 Na+/H+ antiporter subunit E [Mycolicibacterium duvalii]